MNTMKKVIIGIVVVFFAIVGFRLFSEILDPHGYKRQRAERIAAAEEWHDLDKRRKNECEFWDSVGVSKQAAGCATPTPVTPTVPPQTEAPKYPPITIITIAALTRCSSPRAIPARICEFVTSSGDTFTLSSELPPSPAPGNLYTVYFVKGSRIVERVELISSGLSGHNRRSSISGREFIVSKEEAIRMAVQERDYPSGEFPIEIERSNDLCPGVSNCTTLRFNEGVQARLGGEAIKWVNDSRYGEIHLSEEFNQVTFRFSHRGQQVKFRNLVHGMILKLGLDSVKADGLIMKEQTSTSEEM
jgi:hypothetical protein